jgi:hypothetical protein
VAAWYRSPQTLLVDESMVHCTSRLSAQLERYSGVMSTMRLTAIGATCALAFFPTPGRASTFASPHGVATKCRPGHSRLISANSQAQLYKATEPHAFPEYLGVYGCVYGHRPVFLGPLPYASSGGAGGIAYETLAGSMVAYQESTIGGYESGRAEWRVVVRNLRNGRVVQRVPTGQPLTPMPEYVGVGNVVSLTLKSDGAVAWIADDYERSATPNGTGYPYFDVYALDKSGPRLVASGTNIDPSSLALSVGGMNIGMSSQSVVGSTLYWTQGGQSFSTTLN